MIMRLEREVGLDVFWREWLVSLKVLGLGFFGWFREYSEG